MFIDDESIQTNKDTKDLPNLILILTSPVVLSGS